MHGQIHLAAQFTSGVLKCPLEGWIFGAKRAKNETPPPPPVTLEQKVREVSQSGC